MEKELFCEKIKDKVEMYFGDKAEVKRQSVIKNNGLKKEGLLVRMEGSNCAPTIYLDDFYEAFINGSAFDNIVSDICTLMEKHVINENVNIDFFKDFDKVSPYICFRLVSGEKNEDDLENLPHRFVNNLAVTYFVSLEAHGIEGTITIRNEHAKFWGVSEEDLYEMAMDNTPRLYPADIIPIFDVVEGMMTKMGAIDSGIEDWMQEDPGLYVASNERKIKGASVILYPGLLEEVYESLGCGFYIIPSSVHEVIFMKDNNTMDKDTIEYIIRSVNNDCIREEDFLSNNVYYYDGDGENNVKMLEERSSAMLL